MQPRFSIPNATLIALCIVSLAVFGCSSSTTTTPITPTLHTLKVGDNFTYHQHTIDSAGVLVPGSDSTSFAKVNAILPIFMGRSEVAEVIEGMDTTRIKVTNDSSFFLLQNQVTNAGISLPAQWILFDLSENGKTVFDTNFSATISGYPAIVHESVVMTYSGAESVVVGTKIIGSYKFSKDVTVLVTVLGKKYTTVKTATGNFAPTIGYFTSRNLSTSSDVAAIKSGKTFDELLSYSIQ